MVAEGQETMSEDATDEVMDAALIAADQRIEHYEIPATAPPSTTPGTWATPMRPICCAKP